MAQSVSGQQVDAWSDTTKVKHGIIDRALRTATFRTRYPMGDRFDYTVELGQDGEHISGTWSNVDDDLDKGHYVANIN